MPRVYLRELEIKIVVCHMGPYKVIFILLLVTAAYRCLRNEKKKKSQD